MITLLIFLMEILLIIYLTVAMLLFIKFVFGKYNVNVTNYNTNVEQKVSGWKKIKYCLIMSLLWPIILIKGGMQ